MEAGVQVVGVSADSAKKQKAFKEKEKLPFTLIADTEKEVMEAFRAKGKIGFAKRQAFLVIDGKIAWLDLKASTEEQAADVLEALSKLGDPKKE